MSPLLLFGVMLQKNKTGIFFNHPWCLCLQW